MSNIFGNMEEFGAKPQNKSVASSNVSNPTPASTPKKEEYVLVTLYADYADEFDVCHAWTMTREDYNEGVEQSRKEIEARGRNFEIYFGTNEGLQINDFDDYMRNLSVETISKEDYDTFNRMFGGSFGMFSHYFPYGY